MNILTSPWPWYVAGPLIGLTVPLLLLLGNRHFGISANLRHICAACIPGKVPFFSYDWKKESWNLFFAAGILVGGAIAATLLAAASPSGIHPQLENELASYGLSYSGSLVPEDLFNWPALLTLRGLLVMAGGGFLVGFGARYAGGCTSGHAIMGLSNLQWPSLVATCCFMAGGFIMANLILPFILHL
ncbi:YeeE/YedE family protein [Chitinophaga rhizophila]|uniref:YeeE/YedE family protein n=1 Tax=Chitinophaga rhizophila TaxID=2866212 RepID=A0ABS7GL12_9BACT|nr:YeeE/YedE thiosulfate transporter family protein [Chitinophaga rhizophila]MBW8687815.1 YeeE/YedE family protein [Chitinophaga rhizophila]